MNITITIEVELRRESGKFASKEEIVERIVEEIEGANPGSIDGVGADGESVYEIEDWTVEMPVPA